MKVTWTTYTHNHESVGPFACVAAAIGGRDCQRTRHEGVITTEHSQSSYGIPVLVEDTGRVWTAEEVDGTELYKAGYTGNLSDTDSIRRYFQIMDAAKGRGYNVL